LGVVASHDELYGGEEVADELLFLVVQILADAFTDVLAASFEFQDGQP
jgi:hypothetical protein